MTDGLYPDRPEPGPDGSTRKAHYGQGEQPWDVALRLGWGPAFAATCVLRYLRRDKAVEHSLESARWYYAQIYRRAAQPTDGQPTLLWGQVLDDLEHELSRDEMRRLRTR